MTMQSMTEKGLGNHSPGRKELEEIKALIRKVIKYTAPVSGELSGHFRELL